MIELKHKFTWKYIYYPASTALSPAPTHSSAPNPSPVPDSASAPDLYPAPASASAPDLDPTPAPATVFTSAFTSAPDPVYFPVHVPVSAHDPALKSVIPLQKKIDITKYCEKCESLFNAQALFMRNLQKVQYVFSNWVQNFFLIWLVHLIKVLKNRTRKNFLSLESQNNLAHSQLVFNFLPQNSLTGIRFTSFSRVF